MPRKEEKSGIDYAILENDYGADFEDLDDLADLDASLLRVQVPEARPTDERAAELSNRLYGPTETGLAYGHIYTRNVPIEDLSKTRRNEIIAKGKRSRADYVSDDYDATNLHPYHEAWRDAADVLSEQKPKPKTKTKRKRGGTKAKKQRKNKSRKSSRRSHKK